MSGNRPPTLQDIADKTGYGLSTVSLAMRHSTSLRPATRELIQKAAEELGYRPNPLISALMSQVRDKRRCRQEQIALISRFNNPITQAKTGVNFPALRESQALVLSQPNTGMAVAIDLGDRKNIHPKNKRKVGERLALIARRRTYGEDVDDQGPTVGKVESEEMAVRIQFDDTEGDLHAVGGDLKGFEIAGDDEEFVSAEAEIDGDTVILKWAGASRPRFVRYAWAPFSEGNLYDGSNLPAAPFSKEVD